MEPYKRLCIQILPPVNGPVRYLYAPAKSSPVYSRAMCLSTENKSYQALNGKLDRISDERIKLVEYDLTIQKLDQNPSPEIYDMARGLVSFRNVTNKNLTNMLKKQRE